MKRRRIATMIISILLSTFTQAANPFLDARTTSQCPPNFKGPSGAMRFSSTKSRSLREWLRRASPRCRGARFSKSNLPTLESRAPQKREIRPDYFIVTDDRIVLLNEEDNDAAVKKISALDQTAGIRAG